MRAVKWLKKKICSERCALERAQRRFLDKPTEERLHDVRTTGRRFRSLLEDAAELVACKRLLRRVKRISAATDAARDATIIRRLLENSVDSGELAAAIPLLDELHEREASATRSARKHLA